MILFSHTFSSLHLFFQFAGWPSALKKNLLTLSFPPKTLPFFFSPRVSFRFKKNIFLPHFYFLPPSSPLSLFSLFFPTSTPPPHPRSFFFQQSPPPRYLPSFP